MKKASRKYTLLDQLCLNVDQTLKAVFGKATTTQRTNPALAEKEVTLTPEQKKHVAGLMRVNHSGEVCAQALYHAQGLVSRSVQVKEKMQLAAVEEGDHLAWCSSRLTELGSHVSYLNPVWYAGSFAIGLVAGLVGDKWNLGFVAETEHQVVKHLARHMELLPAEDKRSYKILQQMQCDEAQHHHDANQAGAAELPQFIKKLMQVTSKVMVKTAYRL